MDTLTASKKLTRLRDLGLLESNGKARATYYTLKPEFQQKDASEANTFNQDSSTVEVETLSRQSSILNQNSSTVEVETLSRQSSILNQDSSTVEVETLPRQSSTLNQDSSTVEGEQLTLELFPDTKKHLYKID